MDISRILLQATDATIGYRTGKHTCSVHSHLNFTLHKGELTCLLGANGAGKSTLLRTLAAAQPLLEGHITLNGKDLSSLSERERSRNIGVVLTDKTQAGGLTVYELVALGRQPHTGFFGRLHPHDKEIIGHALEAVGIGHKARTYTAELSDGERQKVMIAKALVQECPLILLDEPTAFLDVVSRIEIMHLLHRLAQEEDKAILLSTHDIEQALVLADRLWLLTDTDGLRCGTTEDLILSHAMDSLFPNASDIRFDLMHGIYSPTVEGKRHICLETDDEVLRHWTQNALNRNGFLCLSATDAPETAALPRLHAVSARHFEIRTKGGTRTCTSFEELLEAVQTTGGSRD